MVENLPYYTHLGSFQQYFFQRHHGVVVLVEDGDGLPVVGLQHVQVGGAESGDVGVEVDGVLPG